MDAILNYLKETYHPLAILLYGSWQTHTNDSFSDFDCMLIVPEKSRDHDDTMINGVQLDCFLFTEEEARTGDPDLFLTAYDAELVEDTGIGQRLKARIRAYVAQHADVGEQEKQFIASWIRKTMRRVQKQDDEGNYRAIAFLWESLNDYFILRGMFYFGSRKGVRYLRENDPVGYDLYHRAITERTNVQIAAWAEYIVSAIDAQN